MRMRRATRLGILGTAVLMLASCGRSGGLTRTLTQLSSSMEPAIQRNQVVRVLVTANYVPHRGDIVVFHAPADWLDPKLGGCDCMFKRVIGIPGDKVSSVGATEPVVVNGSPIDEPYLKSSDFPSMSSFSVTVPAGMLWVMGDNRDVSVDSRAHAGDSDDGCIPVSDVIGVYTP